jgi:hypothetical protein
MKLLEWQNFFAEQRTGHGKLVFSVAELANAARTTLHGVNTELGRLLQRGIVERYAHGRYGPTQGVTVEDILPAIDRGAYLTGFYALFHYHLVTQSPTEATCFTNRRHNRKRNGLTEKGNLHFICVPPPIYARRAAGIIATAEQALYDFAWLSLRAGTDPENLVTFRKLETLNQARLQKISHRYPKDVRDAVTRLTKAAARTKANEIQMAKSVRLKSVNKAAVPGIGS